MTYLTQRLKPLTTCSARFLEMTMMNETLEKAPDGTPARWQCRYKNCEWQNIGKREYESLIGDWDYELRTINVVSNDSSID